MKFLCSRAILRLADEEARVRIGIDAVSGIGPLRMIRRKVDSTTIPAVLTARHSTGYTPGYTEVEGNTVPPTSVHQ